MENKLTVLLTTYNCASYIKASVNSISNQTFKDFELLIIDDGSTDNTEDIIRDIQDPRIRYIKTEHKGRSKALNLGLKEAHYDLIALMDADDISLPQRLEKTLRFKEIGCNDIIFSDSLYFFKKSPAYLNTVKENEQVRDKVLLHGHICNSSVIYNRDFVLENGGYDESLPMYEDFELWLRLKDKCNFIRIPEVLSLARIRKQSASRGNDKIALELAKEFHKKYLSNENNLYIDKKRKQLYSERGNPIFEYFFKIKLKPRLELFLYKLKNYKHYTELKSYIVD